MRPCRKWFPAALLAIYLSGGALLAADGLSTQDLAFLQSAARAGATEIRLGQLAIQKATSQAVKNLGQRMVDDHTRANQELATIAQRKGVMLPGEDEAALAASPASQTAGPEFDRLFSGIVVSEHSAEIGMFETEVKSGQDLDVKNWATKVLPTLKTHWADAKALPKEP
ncbi:MAG: DUF4142 domain-containing protein [Acidobacteriota bacterium]